jgi:glucose 1-dehydrogenase
MVIFMGFNGKKVYVTGAGCGIGYEICRQFAEAGAVVGLNSRRLESTEDAAQKINQSLGSQNVSAWPGDLAETEKLCQSIRDFSGKHKGLDVFVANAGITVFQKFLEVNMEEFDHLMTVNMRGTYFSVQTAAKEMVKYGIQGRIILMSSVCGVQAHRCTSAYAMTKAAIRQLAKNLSEELGDYGIRVNVVAPGATVTERTVEDPDYVKGWSSVAPSRTVGTPEDVAYATLFLADDRAKHISGEVIMVDGGWTVTSQLPSHLEKELK